MPEKIAEVRRLSAEEDMTEDMAASEILGISYEELGMTIATEWNFPKKIVQSMHNISPSELVVDPQDTEKLRMVATLSTEISNTLGMDLLKEEKADKLVKLIKDYKNYITVKEEKLDHLIAATSRDLNQLVGELNLDLREISINKQLEDWSGEEGPTTSDAEVLEFKTEAFKPMDAFFKEEDQEEGVSIFSKGIREINTSMLRPFVLNDIITIARPGGALEAFIEAKAGGKIRFIGLTGHYDPELLTRAVKAWPIDSVLLPVNPVEGNLGGFPTSTLPAARAKGVEVIGMKVLGGSHFFIPGTGITAELLIRFALSQPITLAIVGCSSPKEVKTLARIGHHFEPLSPEEQQEILDLYSPYARRLAFYRGMI
jgi:hypothetical protein